jgi:PP-loop superfamily ATP-utilizing enzyme
LRTIAEDKNEQKMKTLLQTTIKTPKLSANVCEGTAKQVATFGQLHEVLETCRRQHYQLCSVVDRCDIDRELLLCKVCVYRQ